VRDSGSTAVQELAIALANGIEYIEACLRRGLHIDDFAHSAYMFLSASVEVFEEAAKFRAARRIWHRLMTERYGAQKPETSALNIFAYTLGGALSAQEPMTNVVRVAYEALAAILGGAQTLATSSYDEALGLPSAEAAQLALKTQQVLAYETGVTRTADPLGGSYYLEYLTDELERQVHRYLEHIAEIGGMLEAIDSGEIQGELSEQAYRHQREIDSGERIVVGLNRFVSTGEGISVTAARVDSEAAEREQIERLRAIRERRDAQAVDQRLSAVRAAAVAGENTIPSIIDAVRVYATLGEICGVLTEVWGRYGGSTRI
jgi:methylmalonyl-CoA mutase, N-terminal domain